MTTYFFVKDVEGVSKTLVLIKEPIYQIHRLISFPPSFCNTLPITPECLLGLLPTWSRVFPVPGPVEVAGVVVSEFQEKGSQDGHFTEGWLRPRPLLS